jgi:transglutaminase-like putative cysteine protease
MRFRITHRTHYSYATPVYESFNEVRLRPASDTTQTCLDFTLSIDPPASVIMFADYYGNTVHDFSVPYLHERLDIEATSDVVTFADASHALTGPRAGDDDRSPAIGNLTTEPAFSNDHAEFLTPSTYVALEDRSHDLARNLLAANPETTAYEYLKSASLYVRERLRYQIGTTNVFSNVGEVLDVGSGVCQDFSHVLISLCRHAGLPARYVSGYLGDVTESEASHAWVEAFVPPYGWIGFDPTSGGPCTGRHVKIAVGRDYADVAVARGTYRGGVAQTLDVSVRSELVSDTQGIVMASTTRRGELIQYQRLGTMQQLQRLGAMTAARSGLVTEIDDGDLVTGVHDMRQHPDIGGEVPRQQPQQQQQESFGARGPDGRARPARGEGEVSCCSV